MSLLLLIICRSSSRVDCSLKIACMATLFSYLSTSPFQYNLLMHKIIYQPISVFHIQNWSSWNTIIISLSLILVLCMTYILSDTVCLCISNEIERYVGPITLLVPIIDEDIRRASCLGFSSFTVPYIKKIHEYLNNV